MSSGDRDSPGLAETNTTGTVEEKYTESQGRSSAAPASGFPLDINDFSSMSELLQEEKLKEFASKISKDPAFSQMVEQLQKDEIPLWDQQFISTMRQFLENPQFMTIAERLCNVLIQDPALASILDISNPDPIEKIERQMLRLREDPSLKPIIDEIEKGGPDEMIYWSYEDILKKLGRGTEIGPLGEATASFEHSEGVEQAEVGDELDIHCAASTGIAKGN